MDEELTLEQALGESQQQDLIRQYCKGIEESIRSAARKSDAEKIVDDTCQRFDHVCDSKLVRRFLARYVRNLFAKYWA